MQMNKKQKLLFDTGLLVLGVVLELVLIGFVYSHLWLGQFDTATDEVALLFSSELNEEYEMMSDIRLVTGFLLVGLYSLTVLAGHKYYQMVDDPRWQMKLGLGSGVLLLMTGAIFYVLTSELFFEAIWVSLLIFGSLSTVGNVAYLMIWDQ